MESLVHNKDEDEVHSNNNNISCLTPELPLSPFLAKVFLQENHSLTKIPPSFFERMPLLNVLDLSYTSIQSLPSAISKLSLLKEFMLRECSLLLELPPQIGALKNLKLFDLERTEIMFLPKEIGKLESLERLRLSFSTYADDYKDNNGIKHIIPRKIISKLTKLKELSINVDPEAEWWEVEVLEAIMEDLLLLPDLKNLKFYLPTAKALKRFLSLERNQVPIYSSLWNFRFLVGKCEQLLFSPQLDIEENFLKLEKCMKYMNGEGHTDEVHELIRNSRALYLRRHWTIENLPINDMKRLKYCLLMECNEMQTLIHQDDSYENKNESSNHDENVLLESLQYLAIHFMKKLQRISKGPIARNSLLCLRILALHTCLELTSVFSGSLLDNFQSLTELIVEDCPKVKSLVSLEESIPLSNGPFLKKLRKVSLLDLPELVSISSGVFIAPKLDTLLVFDCMNLDYLSVMELSRDIKAIKGEIEWWEALKYGKLTWNSVFVELKRDGGLMEQLAEDTNSLQHFLELAEMVPTPPGLTKDNEHVNRLQIDKKLFTQKILNSNNGAKSQYGGTAFRMWDPSCSVSGKPHNENKDCDFKVHDYKDACTNKKSSSIGIAKWTQLVKGTPQIGVQVPSDVAYIQRKCLKNQSLFSTRPSNTHTHEVNMSKGMEVEEAPDDGYSWRKYGKKEILGAMYPRSYYRCGSERIHGCCAKKHVQRSTKDPSVFKVTYQGTHTCPIVLKTNCSLPENESASRSLKTTDLSSVTESASTITDTQLKLATGPQALDFDENIMHTHQVKVISKGIEFEEARNDGYSWWKYGQKEILGAKYHREYYRCTYKFTHGCLATKQIQGSTEDTSVFEVTYWGKHTCPAILSNNCSLPEKESASRTLTTMDSSTTTESASTITDNQLELATRPQVSDFNKKKGCYKQRCQVAVNKKIVSKEAVDDDGYSWRKYGQKAILNSEYPRTYYRCSSKATHGCKALKQVARSTEDPSVYEITYFGNHTCPRLFDTDCSSIVVESALKNVKNIDSSTTSQSGSTITDNSFGPNFTYDEMAFWQTPTTFPVADEIDLNFSSPACWELFDE